MDLQLNGKRALVTGSTVGIGFAIAKALLFLSQVNLPPTFPQR
jgi:NAD(P)-dependent dehydrogenase (short-subunit alcohol dehydrogenase family)